MLGKINRILLFFYLCGICFHSAAQKYGYIQYNADSGAPFDQVSSVIKDKEGLLWIGSQHGLYRFDGIHFDNYSLHTESQFIYKLHESGDDLLFVNEMSLYQIEDVQSKPTVRALLEGTIEENDAKPFYPNDFVLAKDQEIWISQSNHSIGRLHKDGYKTYRFSKTNKSQKLAIEEDSNGGIWVLSPLDGLFFFNTTADSFEKKLNITNGNVLLIHNDDLLIGSDALRVYKRKGNSVQLDKTIAIEDDHVSAIHIDHKEEYIVGTRKGRLFKFSDLNSPPQTIYGANEAHRVVELDFGHINEIYVTTDSISKKDKLWVSSETGLWLLHQRFFKTVENLPLNNPIGLAMGDQGKVWVPMSYLYEISPENDEFSARPIFNNLQANAVAQDIAGFTWVSTTTPKVELLKYDKNRLVERFDFHERGETIFYLFPDSKGNIWFCQAPLNKPIVGVAKISSRGEINYYDDTKGFSSRVLAIKESSRGEIYAVGIGEKSYLYRYDPQQDQFVNLSPELPFTALLNFEAHDLTIDDRGVVWLATTDGLLRYDSEQITLIKNDILGQEEVRGVTHYANNNIWIATATKGLVFHRQNTSTALGEQEGLPAVISAYRCITTDARGHLWAGTAEGLVYSRMSASDLPVSNTPRLRQITINGVESGVAFDQELRLRNNQELELEFTNVSFPAKNVHYQYRLLPEADREIMLEEQIWQSNGTTNTLKLSSLEPGDHYLELRARQPGGYQWSAPLAIQFNVFQPWYLQSWFLYGSIGLLILLIAFYFRIYLMRRFKRLQQVLKYSNEKLADKEAQLHQKIREFEEQKDELANANSNIQTLELFIKEIPEKASWQDIVTAMGKAVNLADDIDAFEIAFKEENEIVHRGFSNQERSGFTFRSKPFNAKTSLTCWAMTNNQEVLINDFEKEHGMYVQEKAAYRFNSLLFIPFTLENGQAVVLCAYSIKKNDIDPNDQIMFRILAQFIHFSIHQKLTKKK
ncbi:GAF domain-containing protein [uncultured Eudoraea sp.]|uniref:GAF domain-containing protein n=1 Tax=uncultured Eudoraea sp. TaxID=1035614 RepID=UPI002617D6D2|nr:GAF domain-containing protein [uncultured Eudoraea sp.]